MIKWTADFLRKLAKEEVEPAISMILGRPFPKWNQLTLNVSWQTLSVMIERITNVDWRVFNEEFRKTGDIGSATKAVFERSRLKKQTQLVQKPLTIIEVRRNFEALAEAEGSGSRQKKERLVEALLSSASPTEAKYLIKIFIGEMRTGFHEGLMEQAVAAASNVPVTEVQKANMIVGDIGEVALLAVNEGASALSKLSFMVFRPVNLMLAQMADSVADALREHCGITALEFKYDGARVQIHKLGEDVRIFSRRLTDVTGSLPEIVELAKANIKAKEAILEGEVVAVDRTGQPVPFQHLMRRFRRVHGIVEMSEEIPLRLYVFDVLYLDGRNLVELPYIERRKILVDAVGKIVLAEQIVTDKPEEAEVFLKEAMDAGQEGLMAKTLDGTYTLGVRGKRWLKIKPVLEPLDLVIVAAEYGYGRRHDWLSDYYLAARDEETGEFLEIGKTFKGLTDVEIIEMTKRLKDLTVQQTRHRVVVFPRIVVEVAYNEIQKSPKYKSRMALRFARITRIREDKTPEQADTIQRVRQIYERQFQKKGRYKTSSLQE